MRRRLKPLFLLLYNPSRGMAEVAAAAPYVVGTALALLASCALYGWAAAHLLMMIPAALIYQPGDTYQQVAETVLQLAPVPYFLFLMVFALRAASRLGVGRAVGAVALGACSLVALVFVSGALLRLLTSPFLLILFILLLRNFFGDLIGQQRAREDFKRHLEVATLNPADASAHYNLGLIYQQRGQTDEARRSFARAIEIDPSELDAHY